MEKFQTRDHAGAKDPDETARESLLTEALSKKDSTQNAKPSEVVIPISEVGNRIGWWQQKQYKELGIERLKLSENSVTMALKAPINKNAFYLKLSLDSQVKFNFDKADTKWTLKNIQGLKVDGQSVSKIESAGKKIYFYTAQDKKEYGAAVQDFTKSLFDPLTKDYLRK